MKTIAHSAFLIYNTGVSWVGHPIQIAAQCLLFLLLSGGLASANALNLGTPRVENDVYSFPVSLQGSEAAVAALDFRFAYDPSVFRPTGVHAGVRAEQANKLVSGNTSGPGDFRVVVMGLNQSLIGNGEIAWVSLERIGNASGAELRIDVPAFATPDGAPLNGQGDLLRLPGEKPEREETPDDSDTEDDVSDESPSSPTEPDEEATSAQRRPMAGLPEAMRATLDEGAEIDGWDAVAENAAAPEEIEDDPTAEDNTETAEWVTIPVTRADAANGEETRSEATPDRASDTLVQEESGPVTIESRERDENLETVYPAPEENAPAVRTPVGRWIALALFAVLFGGMLVLLVRRFSS